VEENTTATAGGGGGGGGGEVVGLAAQLTKVRCSVQHYVMVPLT
jgi:hypothetical protein